MADQVAPVVAAPAAPAGTGGASVSAPSASAELTAAPAAAVAPAPSVVSDWTKSFDEETRGYVQNKGWKDAGEVLHSYKNLEKLHGVPAEKLVKLPDGDDAAGMSALYDKLGRPSKPEEYKLEIPKDGSPEFAKFASEMFHKNGLSAKQGQEIVKAWNEYQAGAMQASEQSLVQKLEVGKQTLQREWGAAHEQNVKVASRAAREFGVTPQALDAMEASMGYDGVMKFFHNIGSKMGESAFVMGSQDNGLFTPDQARSKISALKQDGEFQKKYINGDASAKREMERLHQMAYHGEMAI